MRTARSWPRPLFLLPMSTAAAAALARELHGRAVDVLGVNGMLPAAQVCAEELARLGGGRVEVSMHMRLHELGKFVPPSPVPGGLRAASEQDLGLVVEWLDAFMGDADEQAGRERGASALTAMRHRYRLPPGEESAFFAVEEPVSGRLNNALTPAG